MTRWAKDVTPENVHAEYPRPSLVRKDWLNLNGLWDYAIVPTNSNRPDAFPGKILVPFPAESALSGVKKMVGADNHLWYRRTFSVPREWKGKRVLLNFGAVDWRARVWVNGKEIGSHEGGYDAFTFDVTDALTKKKDQELTVCVWDPSDDGPQPRGKQVKKPGGIWYTPTTGIWQTPWLEPVNPAHLASLKITPDFDNSSVTIVPKLEGISRASELKVEVLEGGAVVQSASLKLEKPSGKSQSTENQRLSLHIPNAKPWSPESPHLYDLRVRLMVRSKEADRVESYFGMRKISLARDAQGNLRMQLNNKPYFQFGPLDQGFWPDGLYTAPTDEALRYDVELTKKLGFNMARKHVKVEPERWYYWCDKLGLLVWQDMPSGDKSAPWKGPSGIDGKEMERTPESIRIYEKELVALLEGRHNHPSIVVWVPFNEGWGQFDTVRILNFTKEFDPSRLVDGASGGNHFPAGDILDHHQYPGPAAPSRVTDRAMVLGEFGGLGLPVSGHTWQEEKNWGYRNFKSADEVTKAYIDLIQKLKPMIKTDGLSAAIYTQTSDVEVEVNGLVTYDRALIKMDADKISAENRSVYDAAP